jgi:hypothetical protein
MTESAGTVPSPKPHGLSGRGPAARETSERPIARVAPAGCHLTSRGDSERASRNMGGYLHCPLQRTNLNRYCR